jgi:hypothetical protein
LCFIQSHRTIRRHKARALTHLHYVWSIVTSLTLILLTWRIWWAPTNANKWQIGFNSAFKGLNRTVYYQAYRRHYTRGARLSCLVWEAILLSMCLNMTPVAIPGIQTPISSSSFNFTSII